jgi:peptide/nickel transport system permease protein
MSIRAVGFYVLRRLVAMAILLLIVSFGVFSLMYIAPGSVVQVLLGTQPRTASVIAALNAEYHLNQPFLVQYWLWVQGALHFQFGRSIVLNEPVTTAIAAQMPVTLFYGTFAFVISMVAGVALGIAAAVKKQTFIDRSIVSTSVLGVSAPSFATGLILLYLFAVRLNWFPVIGAGSGFTDRLWHLTLPAVALAISGTALTVKLTRAALIGALDQDYVAFARARGVPAWRVLVVYGLRNSLVPIITAAGILFASMLTGAVLVEQVFALQGVGSLLINSINDKDVPVVQGVTMLVAALVVVINLIIDLAYLAADPRIRLTGSPA